MSTQIASERCAHVFQRTFIYRGHTHTTRSQYTTPVKCAMHARARAHAPFYICTKSLVLPPHSTRSAPLTRTRPSTHSSSFAITWCIKACPRGASLPPHAMRSDDFDVLHNLATGSGAHVRSTSERAFQGTAGWTSHTLLWSS